MKTSLLKTFFLNNKALAAEKSAMARMYDKPAVYLDKMTPVSGLKNDVFQKSIQSETLTLSILHKPYGAELFSRLKPVCVEIKTQNRAVIYKKILNPETQKVEKVPVEIYVAKAKENQNPAFPTFYFIDKATKKEIGSVSLIDFRHLNNDKSFYNSFKDTPYYEVFPELGIGKDRIAINSLQNNAPDKYSGIGAVADQLALEYCIKENITPNIVSIADKNSHAAHFKRGRRFFNIDKNDVNIDGYEFLKQFKTLNPNEIIERRIKQSVAGDNVYTEDLGQLFMYMPQAVVQKYLKQIKENPILKA